MLQIHRGPIMIKLLSITLTSSRLIGCHRQLVPTASMRSHGPVRHSRFCRTIEQGPARREPCHSDPGSKLVTSAMAAGCLSAMLLGRD